MKNKNKNNPFFIGNILKSIDKKYELKKQKKLSQIEPILTKIIDKQLFQHITLRNIRKGVLYLTIVNPTAEYEFEGIKQRVLTALKNSDIKYKIEDIKIKHK